jgi:hypothetical protein
MAAANKSSKKSSEKFSTEMFADVPVLKRKWQAALRPDERLPRYEDVMLGSLGRLADHIVLLRDVNDTCVVSHSGRYVQKWLNDDRWNLPLSGIAAGLRDGAWRGGVQCAGERPSPSCVGALRARRAGADL